MSESPDNKKDVVIPAEKLPNYAQRVRVIRELMAQGFNEQTAAEHAVAIGDQPELDADGKVIVRAADGRELDRVKLKEFSQ